MKKTGGAVSIQVKGLAELQTLFRQAPREVAKEARTAIQKSILAIERNVKREAPVNKGSAGGNLRQSVKSGMIGAATGKVEVGADYGIYVEKGTRPHIIMPRTARVLASRQGGTRSGGQYQFFGTRVNHPGTRANPFFERGIKGSKREVDAFFVKAVKNVLADIARKV